jgi:hypothetical protein
MLEKGFVKRASDQVQSIDASLEKASCNIRVQSPDLIHVAHVALVRMKRSMAALRGVDALVLTPGDDHDIVAQE